MRKNYSKKYVLLCVFMMFSVIAFAQTGSIKGKVTDETGQALPGASVSIDGTTLGSPTDVNGNYSITGLKPGSFTLTANFLGYVALKKTVTVGNSLISLNFNLQPQSTGLNEVVVIGYGTQKKKDLTGSVSTITAKDFNQGAITTPEDLITGKVSGVSITSNGGAPGAGSTIRIRGGASLNASNDPLIVIDGVPVSDAKKPDGTSAISGVSDPLSMINPNDIESFTVLKDASATAIYGSRASNGVIIITTKKGKGGDKLSVNFSSLNSLSKITKEYPVLSAAQFRTVVNAQDPAQASLLGNANTNWQNQIYQQAFATDNNLNFTGGVKGLPYRLSIGYLDQDGILKTDNLKRTTVALDVNHDFLHNSLKIDLNLKGTYSDSHFANQGAIGTAVNFDPTQPIYSGNSKYGGYFEWLDANGNPSTLAPRNPVGLLQEENANIGTAKRAIGSLNINYVFPFLKELQFNATFGGDISDGTGSNLIPATAAVDFTQKGSYTQYFNENYTYNTDYYLKYAKEFKSINSNLDVQAGYSYQYFNTYLRGEQGYAADKVTPVGNPSLPTYGQYYIASPFGRVNFDIANKYLITATIRDDQSSRFSPSNRNGYFPSVALAWRLKQEDFLKGVDVLSDLKLRGSYGITGQQDLGTNYFPYLAVYEPSNIGAGYQFGNSYTTTLRADAYNANLKWEQTATTDVGLDYGFLNGKINGSIDYYYKNTTNLLVFVQVPDGTNLSNYINANIGSLVTKGIDFNVNYVAIANKDINWTVGYNISYNKRTVTNISLTSDQNQIVATGGIPGGVGNTIQLYKAGVAPNAFYVYQQVYGANGMPLEGVYVDRNGNGSVGTEDKYAYQQPNPTVFMGFNSNFSYKKWNLAFTLRSELGNYVYNAEAAANGAYAGIKFSNYLNNLPSSILKTNFQQYQLFSDYYVENASFLKMDNINLGYNFGKIDKVGTLRASFNVQNVFVITKYTGLDPEVQGGIDNQLYPRPRIYSIGINLGF
ncbi:MAG: iron complex outerrane recepter protein [Mucilaginibacter sp.]|nr:iron complex outerrane recepter protein [Mucilaginibacter sp.]